MKSLNVLMFLVSWLLVGCNGGGGGSGHGGSSGGSTYGSYQSPSVTASAFVNALNNVDGTWETAIELYADETYRTFEPGQEDWFVIWDALFGEYKAVSLQYIRSIVYYDYYASSNALAEEFREIELDDIASGELNGDFWGDDYEVVDYDSWTDSFWGRNSGFEYEDESETHDVSLMEAEKEKMAFYKKAASVSFSFSVPLNTAMSLVTLGSKVEKMLKSSSGDLTLEDQVALTTDLESLTGASLSDVLKASTSESARKDLVEKIANKIGTTSASLEQKLLPEVLGISL